MAAWICQVSLSKMKFEIRSTKNGALLRVEHDYPEGETEEISSAILMDISEEWESSKTYLPQISNN